MNILIFCRIADLSQMEEAIEESFVPILEPIRCKPSAYLEKNPCSHVLLGGIYNGDFDELVKALPHNSVTRVPRIRAEGEFAVRSLRFLEERGFVPVDYLTQRI